MQLSTFSEKNTIFEYYLTTKNKKNLGDLN